MNLIHLLCVNNNKNNDAKQNNIFYFVTLNNNNYMIFPKNNVFSSFEFNFNWVTRYF